MAHSQKTAIDPQQANLASRNLIQPNLSVLEMQPSQTEQTQRPQQSNQKLQTLYDQQTRKESLPNINEDLGWNTVQHTRKRNRVSPDKRVAKQTKIQDYWLNSPTLVTNKFATLGNEEDGNSNTQQNNMKQSKVIKTPPIFVSGVQNITPLIQLLNKIAKDNYQLKVINPNQVRIQPKSNESYSTITNSLTEKKTEFYTYKPKEERCFRVVVKNLHHSSNVEELKADIEERGHTVENIWNIKHFRTKDPLPMFFVDLKPSINNKDIYNIDIMLSQKVIIEPPRAKRNIPQCARCQRYGHTKAYCHLSPRCVKCAGDHMTANCSRKEKSDKVKCVLCEGNHPANYKGCTVYKELQQKKYPTVRPKNATRTIPSVQHGVTYSQATTNGLPSQPNNHTDLHHSNQPASPAENYLSELKDMMKTLMQQMSTILNLLTTVLTKLK